jgi:hypothetical protein
MELKRENYLPMLQKIPNAGHMQRPTTAESYTDSGIAQRIMAAAQQGLIHPEVAKFLMDNMLETGRVPPGFPAAPVQPNQVDVVRGLLSR